MGTTDYPILALNMLSSHNIIVPFLNNIDRTNYTLALRKWIMNACYYCGHESANYNQYNCMEGLTRLGIVTTSLMERTLGSSGQDK